MAELGEELSDRELEVLQCLVDGSSNKEVASQLFISPHTVKVHLRNVYTKLGVSSRTEAATVALQQGLITLPGEKPVTPESAPEEELAPESETAVAPSTPESSPDETASSRVNWRSIALVIVSVLLVLTVSYVGLQAWRATNTPDPTPPLEATAVLFVEEKIGDTSWWRSRPLPQPKTGMAVAAVGLNVYAIGGQTAAGVVTTASVVTTAGVVNDVMVYDTSQRIWQAGAAKPTAVTAATAAVLFGEIYVVGGRLEDGTETAVVEVYSPTNQAWRPAAALPQPIAGGLTLSDGSFLYLFGGYSNGAALTDAYVYDAAADSWRPLPPLTQPRAYAAGGHLAGQLYVVGGENGESALSTCSYFDASDAEWHDCPDMLLPRSKASATDLLNKLYMFGGETDGSGQAVYSEVYDPANGTWQVVNMPLSEERLVWQNLGVTHIENRIYALGGQRGDNLLDDNLVYTPFVYQTFIPAAVSD